MGVSRTHLLFSSSFQSAASSACRGWTLCSDRRFFPRCTGLLAVARACPRVATGWRPHRQHCVECLRNRRQESMHICTPIRAVQDYPYPGGPGLPLSGRSRTTPIRAVQDYPYPGGPGLPLSGRSRTTPIRAVQDYPYPGGPGLPLSGRSRTTPIRAVQDYPYPGGPGLPLSGRSRTGH